MYIVAVKGVGTIGNTSMLYETAWLLRKVRALYEVRGR